MSKVQIKGNVSGTGTVTIESPNTNTDRTLTLPDATGTFNTSGAVNEVPAGSVSAPAIYPTGDSNTGIYFPAADTIGFVCGGTEDFRVDGDGQLWNTVASEVGTDYTTLYKGYLCRAWVNFNGTGTVAIRASGNVSSITDNGTGDYTVNFTTAMPDANYGVALTWGGTVNAFAGRTYDDVTARSTTAVRVSTVTTAPAFIDAAQITVAIFR